MHAASDIFLGWTRGPRGRDFYVRQLRDMKLAPDVEAQTPQVMRTYATLCGLVLARAHDKAGDAAMIAGYLGKAVRSGRLKSDLKVQVGWQQRCAEFRVRYSRLLHPKRRSIPFSISPTGITVAANGSAGITPGSAIPMKSLNSIGTTRILRTSS
jgi:Uncharacterized protein conserved in bacteria (DUF2252)